MKYFVTNRFTLVALALVVGLIMTSDVATAQEEKSSKIEITQNGETVKIEVKDGRTYVNGEIIPEGADVSDYLPEGFDSDVVVFDDGDIHMFGRGGGLYGFRNRAGGRGNSVYFSDGDVSLEVDGLARKLEELKANSFELSQNPYVDGLRSFSFGDFFGASSPEISKKERRTRELARELKKADGSDRAELEAELDELLEEIFEAKMELREERIAKQRQSLEEQEASLNERRARKSEIIERRKADLTGSDDRYRW